MTIEAKTTYVKQEVVRITIDLTPDELTVLCNNFTAALPYRPGQLFLTLQREFAEALAKHEHETDVK